MHDAKAAARKIAFAARKQAHAAAAAKTDLATAHLLAAVPVDARIVAGYMPIRTEIDPIPAMDVLFGQGRRVCVPVIQGPGQPLIFREWQPDVALIDGPFGALIPETGETLVPDTLIVPLVAFDAHANRLGYGGGYYDRTLEGLRLAAPTTAIGFAYAAQELPDLPQEPTDQRLDTLITENGPLASPSGPA